jgi:hypothetical protein
MAPRFGDFMLGLTVIIAQSALFGMFSLWLASRASRTARIFGGIFIVLMAWMSFVPVLDRATGYQPRSDLDVSLSTTAALVIGWIAGRNRRLRGTERLLFDDKIRLVGAGLVVIAYLYGMVIGLFTFLIELGIVADAAGFWGFVVACSIAPITFAVAPLYAGIHLRDWMPVVFAYGGTVTMGLAFAFGKLVSEEPM